MEVYSYKILKYIQGGIVLFEGRLWHVKGIWQILKQQLKNKTEHCT